MGAVSVGPGVARPARDVKSALNLVSPDGSPRGDWAWREREAVPTSWHVAVTSIPGRLWFTPLPPILGEHDGVVGMGAHPPEPIPAVLSMRSR